MLASTWKIKLACRAQTSTYFQASRDCRLNAVRWPTRKQDNEKALSLLVGTKNKRGALEHIRMLNAETSNTLPRFGEVLLRWEHQVIEAQATKTASSALIASARDRWILIATVAFG